MSKHSSSKLGMLVLYSLVFTKWRVFRRQLSKLSNLVVLAACGGGGGELPTRRRRRTPDATAAARKTKILLQPSTHTFLCAVQCSSAKQSCIGFLPSEELFLRAFHKVRQHFLGEKGSKIEEKVMTDMYKIVMT
jgi:hypothetical protein